MGANYSKLGYASVEEMVRDLSISEKPHLRAFVKFVGSDKNLLKAVREKNFSAFALNYNGAGYRENDYDGVMKRNYEKLLGSK